MKSNYKQIRSKCWDVSSNPIHEITMMLWSVIYLEYDLGKKYYLVTSVPC